MVPITLFFLFYLFFQEAGLNELNKVYIEKKALHQFLACLILLGYNLVVSFFLGNPCNNELCKEILDEKLAKYPNSGLFLFFRGRYHFIQVKMKENFGKNSGKNSDNN